MTNLSVIQGIYFGVVAVSLLLLIKQRYSWWIGTTAIQMAMLGYTAVVNSNVTARQASMVMFISIIISTLVTAYNYLELNKWEYFPHIFEGGAIMLIFNSLAGMFDSAIVKGVSSLTFMYYVMLFGLLGVGYFFLSFRCYIGLIVLGIHYMICAVIWYIEPNASVMSVLYKPEYCVVMCVVCFYGYFKLNNKFKEMILNEKNK